MLLTRSSKIPIFYVLIPKNFHLVGIVCDFEENRICSPDIRQPRTDNFDWVVNSGSTPTAGTGPDSAASGTKYIMIEASSRNQGETAKLETSSVPARCKSHNFIKAGY